jgi:hypothetical protein
MRGLKDEGYVSLGRDEGGNGARGSELRREVRERVRRGP